MGDEKNREFLLHLCSFESLSRERPKKKGEKKRGFDVLYYSCIQLAGGVAFKLSFSPEN